MRVGGSVWSVRSAAVPLILCLMCGWIRAARSQQAVEVSPRVQALYAEATRASHEGNGPLAIAKYEAILKVAPRLAPAYNNLGSLYYDAGDYTAAARILERGLALDPKMTSASGVLGMSYLKLGRDKEAKPCLEAAVAARPADDALRFSLARSLVDLGEYDEAADQLRLYVGRNPKDQAALYLLGKTYLQLSEAALIKIRTINPDSVTAHEVAGEIDESMHNYDGALAEYNRAVQLAPNQPGTHYRLGNTFWIEGKWESARVEFETDLRNDPRNCTTEWKLGNTLLAANNPPSEALTHLNKAIEICPGLMQAHADRAAALLKLDQPQSAIEDLLIAVKDAPKEPSIHFLLSKAYKSLGKTDESRAELDTYGRLQREAGEATAARAGDVIQIKNMAK